MVEMVGNGMLSVSKEIVQSFLEFVAHPICFLPAFECLSSQKSVERFLVATKERGGEKQLRVISFLFSLSSSSAEFFEKARQTALREILFIPFSITEKEIAADVLLAVSLLEVILDFSKTNHGCAFLSEIKFLKKLHLFAQNPMLSIVSFQLLEEVLKCGGTQNAELGEWENLIDQCISQGTIGLQCSALYCLGRLSALAAGAPASAWKRVPDFVMGTNSELKIASVFALSEVAEKVEFQNIFEQIGKHGSMHHFFGILKTPIEDQRNAVFRLVSILAKLPWGCKAILETPGMIEWLLNRNTESSLVGIDWKYTIIQVLAKSTSIDAVSRRNFEQYLAQGRVFQSRDVLVNVEY